MSRIARPHEYMIPKSRGRAQAPLDAGVVKTRRPRMKAPDHLDCIRQLPCLCCGGSPVEAAHIRSGSRRFAKRPTGGQEKPSDQWTTPLCPAHHREQHAVNEIDFWQAHGIDPFVTALALWEASGDHERMVQIVMEARTAA